MSLLSIYAMLGSIHLSLAVLSIVRLVQIVNSKNVASKHQQHEWAIEGNCPEPQPIKNTYRNTSQNEVIYTCMSGSELHSGNLTVTCDSGNYTRPWPQCLVNCSSPLTWSWAPIVTYQGSLEGDYVKYQCTSYSNFSSSMNDAYARCVPETGWYTSYPGCFQTQSSSITGYIDDKGNTLLSNSYDCVTTYGSSYITIKLKETPFTDIYSFSVSLNHHHSKEWVTQSYFSYYTHDSRSRSANMSVENPSGLYSLTDTISSVARATTSIRVGSRLSPASISICSPKINGRQHEGGCAKPIALFKTKPKIDYGLTSYSTLTKIEYECFGGFHYIGGQKELTCHYQRTWVPEGLFMECTDRVNHASDASAHINVTTTSGSSIEDTYLSSDGALSDNHFPYDAISAIMTVELQDKVAIERVTIEFSGNQKVNSITILESIHSSTVGKSCDLSNRHSYKEKSQTFVCLLRPTGSVLTFDIVSNEYPPAPWTISYMCVTGESNGDPLSQLECYVEDKGTDYAGFKNVTIDGEVCMPWKKFTNDFDSFVDFNIDETHNFCRNPDPANHDVPYCMTQNGEKACSVAPCERVCSVDVRGEYYLGHHAKTTSGITCLAWKESGLQFQKKYEFYDRSLSQPSNYCRNPAFSQSKPWCYISTSPLQTEHCVIPVCPRSGDFDNMAIGYNVEVFTSRLNSSQIDRCFAFDLFSSRRGKGAWVDVTSGVFLSDTCQKASPGAFIELICLIPDNTKELKWHEVTTSCPYPTTTSTTKTTATSPSQTPITLTTLSTYSTSTSKSSSSLASFSTTHNMIQLTYPSQSPNNGCSCHLTPSSITYDPEELEKLTRAIVEELTVDKERLSSSVRAKTSAYDSRPSAIATGAVGVIILACMTAVVTIPDIMALVSYLRE